MEAVCFSEMLVATYNTARYHNPEDHNHREIFRIYEN
jgi:hypothetical protein